MSLVQQSAKAGTSVPWTEIAKVVGVAPSPQLLKEDEAVMAKKVENKVDNRSRSVAGSSRSEADALPIPPRRWPASPTVSASPKRSSAVEKGKGKERIPDGKCSGNMHIW